MKWQKDGELLDASKHSVSLARAELGHLVKKKDISKSAVLMADGFTVFPYAFTHASS